MINIEDLHIEEEIIPLFDFTFNLSSGEAVREIITKPLNSISEILQRQNLLKGFLDNGEILKDYSYSRFDLSEVHTFFESLPAGSFFEGSLRWRLRFSEKERHHKRGKLILLILLFNRIDSVYLAKLDMNSFPKEYALELATIRNFFADFNLGHYEAIFRKKKIRVRHIVELMKILTEKVTTGEAASFWKRWFLFEAYLSV